MLRAVPGRTPRIDPDAYVACDYIHLWRRDYNGR